MSSKIAAADVTPEIIAKWKQQYGSVARLKIKETFNDGDVSEKIAYVRKPTNKEIDFASANLTRGALTQYGIALFNTCHIAGDTPETEEGMRAAGQYMSEMIETAEVELEKL